ncbi:unnamed protein product [Urochloa humidicola]
MAAWSRIGRGVQSLSRIVSEGGGGVSSLRGATVLCRGRGQHYASSLHSLALFPGLAGRSACAGGHLLFQTPPPPMSSRGIATAPSSPPAPPPQHFGMPSLGPTRPAEKPRLVVLGTGWGGVPAPQGRGHERLRCGVRVPAEPHGVHASAGVDVRGHAGVPLRRRARQPHPVGARHPPRLLLLPRLVHRHRHEGEVHCTAEAAAGSEPYQFKVAYDKLVIASGAEPLTFNIKGVKENAIFLREVSHAQEIRRKLLTNLMLSENPGLTEEKARLLHCVVVGGGPTGVEFSGELTDFIMRDVPERYAHVKDDVKVTLIEANEILSSFDVGLRQYATNHLSKYGVKLLRGIVKEVKPTEITLSDGTRVPYGLLVWSTGVGPSEFVKSLDLPKSPGGRIGVDEWLRVLSAPDVFALGDCAGFLEQTGKPVLPALAQVAEREGRYLARLLGKVAAQGGSKAHCAVKAKNLGEPFVYKHKGSMASVGRYKALVDLRENKDARGVSMAGFLSWVMWRSAYLTKVVSWRNRFYVPVNWATTLVFGRDNTRIG